MGSYVSLHGRVLGVDGDTGRIISPVSETAINSAVGTKSTSTTVVAKEYGSPLLHKTQLVCTATPISVADDAGVAQYGGVSLYTFPEGFVVLHGAMIQGVIGVVSGTIIATFAGAIALGSAVAGTGTTLVTTEATWLQSSALTTAVASVAAIGAAFPVATQITESGARWYNGTATAGPVFLNLAIADDATHTAAVMSYTGTITLLWSLLGDL